MIITLAEVKRYLNIDGSDTSQDLLLTDLISRAEAKIGHYFGGKLEADTYVDERYDPSPILYPNHYPIIFVLNLYLNDILLVENSDYFVYPTYISLNATGERKSIKISYKAGFETIPNDIKQAIILTVANLLKINVDLQPQQIEDTRLTREVTELLNPYLRMVI